MNRSKFRKILSKSLPLLLAVIFVFGALSLFHPFRREVRVIGQTSVAHLYAAPTDSFPQISTTGLSRLQQRIVALTKQEYAKQPVSYDASVLEYTQGSKEPWCADFASWIFMQAGAPFSNPNSGSWRIPGVYTLQEYFQANGTYMAAGAYTPKTGDVAIYHAGEGHTNIVLGIHNGEMITVGGNEHARIRIEIQPYTPGTNGLDGFGIINKSMSNGLDR